MKTSKQSDNKGEEADEQILAPAPLTEPLVIPGREPVPVTLLIGFLGSGKTTLLNRILNGDHGLRVGVLVNDFGAINIDADLVDGVEENTISLTNGCICCEIRDDLVSSLEQMLLRVEQIDYVILEASGVADPEGVVMTFLSSKYEQLLRLDSITCIVDAEAVFTHGDNEALNMLKLRQVGFADLVVLNKVDLVSSEHVEVIHDWIGQVLNRVRIVEATHCDVPLEVLLSVGRFDVANMEMQDDGRGDLDERWEPVSIKGIFERWSYETDRPLSLDALREMVRRQLPSSVYRCKGIIYIAESPEKRYTLQVVGRRTEVKELDDWDKRTPRTRIVAIGGSGEIDSQSLTEMFDSCLS